MPKKLNKKVETHEFFTGSGLQKRKFVATIERNSVQESVNQPGNYLETGGYKEENHENIIVRCLFRSKQKVLQKMALLPLVSTERKGVSGYTYIFNPKVKPELLAEERLAYLKKLASGEEKLPEIKQNSDNDPKKFPGSGEEVDLAEKEQTSQTSPNKNIARIPEDGC